MILRDEPTHKNIDTLQNETGKESYLKKQTMPPSSKSREDCSNADDESRSKVESLKEGTESKLIADTREPAPSERKSCVPFLIGKPLPAAPILPSIQNPAPPVAPIFVPSLGVKRPRSALVSKSESQKRFKMPRKGSLPETTQDGLAAIALSELRLLSHRHRVPSQHPLPPPPALVSVPPPT